MGKHVYRLVFGLFLVISIPNVIKAECPEDDEDCQLREGGIIINRHVLEDSIYRNPAVPLLSDPSARPSITSSSPVPQKIKQPDKAKSKADKVMIEIPRPADEAIQNAVQQHQTQQEQQKNKLDAALHKITKYDLRLEFPVGIAQLDQKAQNGLGQLGLMLKNQPNWHVHLYGYAGLSADVDGQMRLAFDRVQQVKSYLSQIGIEPTHLHLYVIGESNDPPYDRVDIVVMKD